MRRPGPPIILAVVVLAGCKLIDQRTFERTGATPSPAQLAHSAELAAGPARPLVTVFPGDLDRDWRSDVLTAVRDAMVRHPDAAFDIVAPFPTTKGAAAQLQAQDTGGADAAAVAAIIEGDGVPAERLHLGARGDPGNPPREVLVLLR